jgi:hypothetical protein
MSLVIRVSCLSGILACVASFNQSSASTNDLPGLRADVLCTVVGIKAAKASDSARRTAGLVTALFYLGSVDARAPNGSGDKMITDELAAISNTELHAEAIRCGNDLSRKGEWLERVGKAFSETR